VRNAIDCYIVRPDLLVLVPDTDEMAQHIRERVGPPPEGTHWIVLPPGSTVSDVREATAAPKHRADQCDVTRNGDQFLCRYHGRYWTSGICPGLTS
jgi:hypothetical protein